MDFLHVLQSARNEKKKVREKRSLHVSKLQEKSLKASLQAVVCICMHQTYTSSKNSSSRTSSKLHSSIQHCSRTTADLRLLRTRGKLLPFEFILNSLENANNYRDDQVCCCNKTTKDVSKVNFHETQIRQVLFFFGMILRYSIEQFMCIFSSSLSSSSFRCLGQLASQPRCRRVWHHQH